MRHQETQAKAKKLKGRAKEAVGIGIITGTLSTPSHRSARQGFKSSG